MVVGSWHEFLIFILSAVRRNLQRCDCRNILALIIQGAVGVGISGEKPGIFEDLVDTVALGTELGTGALGDHRLRTSLFTAFSFHGGFQSLFPYNRVFLFLCWRDVVGSPTSSDSFQGFSQFRRLFDVWHILLNCVL